MNLSKKELALSHGWEVSWVTRQNLRMYRLCTPSLTHFLVIIIIFFFIKLWWLKMVGRVCYNWGLCVGKLGLNSCILWLFFFFLIFCTASRSGERRTILDNRCESFFFFFFSFSPHPVDMPEAPVWWLTLVVSYTSRLSERCRKCGTGFISASSSFEVSGQATWLMVSGTWPSPSMLWK